MNDDFEDPPEQETKEQETKKQEAKEQVDKDLPEKALKDFKALVRGNGLKPDNIALKEFEGEVFTFDAYEIFKIETSVTETHILGRENGEIVGSYTDAQKEIKKAVEKITLDKNVKQLTVNLLRKRKDLGFGIDGQIINLERSNKKFVIHEPCNPCNSRGKIICKNCRGKKLIICLKCQGQRHTQCHICHGAQQINTPQGRQQCTHCHGRGQVGCEMCRQTGDVPCPKCHATGRMPCHTCGSTGWNSHSFHVAISAKGNFDFERNNMPEELLELIGEYRTRLVTEGHALVRIVEDSRTNEEVDSRSAANEYIIPYQAKIPWGDIEFSIKDKSIKGKLFGLNPLLLNMPPIIEKMIGKHRRSLDSAARGEGNIAQHIKNAIGVRAIGEVFLATIPHSQKKSRAIIRRKYPYGINPETLDNMVIQASAAMKNLTKKPRLTGLGIGAGISAAFYAAYFIGPLRNIITINLPPSLPGIVLDLGSILINGTIITASIQMSADKALKKALGKILNKSNKSKIMPKLSKSILWGYPTALALFIAFLVLAMVTGIPLPKWLGL